MSILDHITEELETSGALAGNRSAGTDWQDAVMLAVTLGELTPGELPIQLRLWNTPGITAETAAVIARNFPSIPTGKYNLLRVPGRCTNGIGRYSPLKAIELRIMTMVANGNPAVKGISKVTTKGLREYRTLTDADVQRYYDTHPDRLTVHNQIKADRDALIAERKAAKEQPSPAPAPPPALAPAPAPNVKK